MRGFGSVHLKGKAAEDFIKQDREPLTKEQIVFLKKCHRIYLDCRDSKS